MTKIEEALSLYDEVLIFAQSVCRDWHLAEDLTQEVMIKTTTNNKLDKVNAVKAYMFRSVRNLFCTHYKKQKRRPRAVQIPEGI